MTALVAADILKLRRRRGLWFTLLALPAGLALLVGVLGAAISDLKVHGGGRYAHDARFTIGLLLDVMAAIVGARLGSEEHTLGTFRYQVLSGRPRLALYGSKVGALVSVLTITVVLATIATAVASFLPPRGGGHALTASDLGKLLWDLWLPAVAYGCLSLGVGSLVRATGGAIALSLVLQLAALNLLAALTLIDKSFKYVVLNAGIDRLTVDTLKPDVRLSAGGAAACVIAWVALFLFLGAARTQGSED
jgi:ABC-type transport system involved in multi-copper enzyme maturation permease subunit